MIRAVSCNCPRFQQQKLDGKYRGVFDKPEDYLSHYVTCPVWDLGNRGAWVEAVPGEHYTEWIQQTYRSVEILAVKMSRMRVRYELPTRHVESWRPLIQVEGRRVYLPRVRPE